MPSTYAHYRFGVGLLPTLPGDVRRTIQRFRRLFDVGLHGPDIFYYQSALGKAASRFLGVKYHDQTGKEFFQRVCRAVRLERSEAAQAYLYGLLCHYCLDAALHPFVKSSASGDGPSHLEIEAEFDRFLLALDGKTPPCAQDLSPHLKLTPGEWETVAKFYPPTTSRTVRDSLQNMIRLLRVTAVPEGAKRTLVEKSMALLGGEFRDMLIPVEPNPKCTQMNAALLERYNGAVEAFPALLTQLQAHMTYSAPFEEGFDSTFG